MTRTRRLSFFAIVLAPAVWLGCNAILGNDEARFVPQEGGPGDESSTSDNVNPNADGSSDGSIGDADAAITCDADLQNDPLHCGSCTRDCFGGGCEAGACGAVRVATDTRMIKQLAVDATHVYWINAGTNPEIRRRALAGADGGPGEVVTSVTDPTFLSGITVTNKVYFGTSVVNDAGTISSCDPNGCAGGPTVVTSVTSPRGIAVSGGVMYWTSDTSVGSMNRCTLPGCAAPVAIASAERFPDNVLVDNGEVVWGSGIGSYVHAAPLVMGGPRVIVEDAGFMSGLAVNADHVYYASTTRGISIAPRGGGIGTLLTATGSQARDVAADGNHVYFADYSNTLYRCPVASCTSVTTIATVPASSTYGVVLDPASVYWIAQDTLGGPQAIWRVAK